jgi:hypothetical protein
MSRPPVPRPRARLYCRIDLRDRGLPARLCAPASGDDLELRPAAFDHDSFASLGIVEDVRHARTGFSG